MPCIVPSLYWYSLSGIVKVIHIPVISFHVAAMKRMKTSACSQFINSGTRELTLKCKLKCYFKPTNNPLDVSPSKGNREPHEAKKKSFDLGGNRTHDLRIRSTVTLPTELQGRTEKVGDDSLVNSLVPLFVFPVLRGTTFICTHTFSIHRSLDEWSNDISR